MNHRLVAWLTLLLLAVPVLGQSADNLGFKVPDGFEVTLYADDSLANDIHSLTIDAHGRVVVAGKGYIKILHDTKGTGKADKATVFANLPKSGAQGMYFDGDDLICSGDKGVRRLYDTRGVGQCDKVSEPLFATKHDGEHSAHAILKGPDGWFYMIAGNGTGIDKSFITSPSSPVKNPGQGTIVRFSPDGKTREVVAHGFRNPYRFAFNHLGQMFTVDSDGERIFHLPYYAPTRLFDVAQGMHHGWVLPASDRSWSRPAYWPDNVERMVEIGRGSPTGAVVYRHRAFPEKYRNGFFSLCWSYGRLYFFPLTPKFSTYESKMEVFMRTTGDVGFAPTDLAIGPDGDLFIAIGGRGTRGSVFRVHYKGPLGVSRETTSPIRSVLAAADPLSSWSRARWVPAAKKLGKDVFVKSVLDEKLPLEERIRAVEILTELFGGIPIDAAKKICGGKEFPNLQARVVWSLSRTTDTSEARRVMMSLTNEADVRVQRAAWEALQALPTKTPFDPANPTIWQAWNIGYTSPDRRVRAATILAGLGTQGEGSSGFVHNLMSPTERDRAALALAWLATSQPKAVFAICQEIVAKSTDPESRLEAVRLLQLGLGDVDPGDPGPNQAFAGYVARNAGGVEKKLLQEYASVLAKSFPSGNTLVDLELARLFGMMKADVPGLLERLATRWTKTSSSDDDIHYLLVLSQLPGQRSPEVTRKTAEALNGFHIKLAGRGARPADQVPGILETLLKRLIKLDPDLPRALVADAGFGIPGQSIVGHSLYANDLPEEIKPLAIRKLLTGLEKYQAVTEDDAQDAWTPDLIRLVATLPDKESLPILRQRFNDPRLTDTIALILARKRQPEDRGRWIEALNSTQPIIIGQSAEALLSLPRSAKKAEPVELGKIVRGLRRVAGVKADPAIEKALVQLLETWTGEHLGTSKLSSADAWVAWFKAGYPRVELPGLASAGWSIWKKRLDAISWENGDSALGDKIFQRQNCYRCHMDARRLGPDLTGVAQRLSRDDLFEAIVDPSKDIAPTYQSTTVFTRSGKIHTGLIVYKSQQLTLLQTTPDTVVRIADDDLQRFEPSNISFMPTGLLDDLSDTDLRNLYAYVKTLRASRAP